jgi:hypothetical protein
VENLSSYFKLYFIIESGMVNESNTITHLGGRKDGQAWFEVA